MKTFKTKTEAINAGFIAARPRVIDDHRDFKISIKDTSGSNAMGYSYGVVIRPKEGFLGPEYDRARDAIGMFMVDEKLFCSAETVWLSEALNKIKKPGCFWVAFDRSSLEMAVATAKKAIDSFYQ